MKDTLPTFVFIAGHHKSGTSLVHKMLRAHTDIEGFVETSSARNEGQHLQNLIPSAKHLGGPTKYIFNERSYMNETHPLATATTSKQLIEQWSKYSNFNSKFFIEKSPPNLIRTRFLQALFPDSKFIVILRHPLAVTCAARKFLKSKRLRASRMRKILEHTLLGYDMFFNDLPHLKKTLVVRYEELVLHPQQTVDLMFSFIGVPTMRVKQKTIQNINDKYFLMWKEQCGEEYIDISDLKEKANKFGYSLLI